MKFLSALAAAVFATTAFADYKECNQGPFAPLQAVGDKHDASKSDVDICEQAWTKGGVVNGMEVWGSKSRISGILLSFSNGDKSHMIGSRQGDKYGKLEWDTKTTVSRVSLWSDWDARQLGGLYVELSDGQKLEIKQDKISSVIFNPDVGSGILLGGFGRADDHITAWGWMFLEDEVQKITVNDFKWDQTLEEYRKKKNGNERQVIDTASNYNLGSENMDTHIEKKLDKKNSYAYSQKTTTTFGLGYSLEISGQVAGVGPKATYSVQFQMSKEEAKTWTQETDAGLSVKNIITTRPGYTAMCYGYAEFNEFDMGYEAQVTLTLKNGKTFGFRERGVKKQTLYAEAQSQCADEEGDHRKEDPRDFVERRARERKEADDKKKKEEEQRKKKEAEDKKKQEEAARNGTLTTPPAANGTNSTAPSKNPKRSGVVSLPFTA